MGYASYLEDIIERFNDSCRQIEVELAQPTPSAADRKRSLESCLVLGQELLKRLQEHLDLVTDPAFELVAEFTELKRKHRSLASDVVGAERRLEKLNNQIREQEQKLKKEKARTRDARRDALKAKQDLEGVLKANPEAGYEYFSSDDRIRKLKPER